MLANVIWIYSGVARPHPGKQPLMSSNLINLLEAYKDRWSFIHLHHLGTVGDDRHKRESSTSYHLHEPPDAIDITSIGEYDCTNIEERLLVAKRFAKLGGVCFHAGNSKRGHLHVQTPGRYAGKYRSGEVNLR